MKSHFYIHPHTRIYKNANAFCKIGIPENIFKNHGQIHSFDPRDMVGFLGWFIQGNWDRIKLVSCVYSCDEKYLGVDNKGKNCKILLETR